MDLVNPKLTQDEAIDLLKPLERDLMAYYESLQEATIDILQNGTKTRMSPDQIIREIENLFKDDIKINIDED